MVDVSNNEIFINATIFHDMKRRYDLWLSSKNVEPQIVHLKEDSNDYVTVERFKDMIKRFEDYKKSNGTEPVNVWIKKSASGDIKREDIISDNSSVTLNFKGQNKKFSDFTSVYNAFGGFGYSHYFNDILSLNEELAGLTNGKAMNCTDFAQVGVYIATKLGYQTRYRHVICKKSGGHTQFEIKGKEFKNWTVVDLAAKADKNARNYPLGDGWCMDGKVRGYNEPWIMKDNGKA
ncbi:MAG: hypothetical protein LBM96_12350 [Methanobrevibacter sp.]|jgi:hypothetical protein|nr:hypothetical protein [Candidatus Methanoflexus mossambicus]